MSSFLRSLPRATARLQPSTITASSLAPRRLAHEGYGDNSGPISENPKDQGKNPREDAEHPGPAPPSAAQQGNTHQDADRAQQKGQASSNDNTGGSQDKGNKKPQPKIHNESYNQKSREGGGSSSSSSKSNAPQPKIHNESHKTASANPEEVERHNQEMEKRGAKTSQKSRDEKVEKGFWSGREGGDRPS